MEVPPEAAGARLDKAVRKLFHVTWNSARSWIENGKVFIDGVVQTDISFPVVSGQWLSMREDAPRPGKEGELSRDQIVYIDAHVVVVEKPTGMLSVPFEEGDRGTLDQQVRSLLARILPKATRRRGPLRRLVSANPSNERSRTPTGTIRRLGALPCRALRRGSTTR